MQGGPQSDGQPYTLKDGTAQTRLSWEAPHSSVSSHSAGQSHSKRRPTLCRAVSQPARLAHSLHELYALQSRPIPSSRPHSFMCGLQYGQPCRDTMGPILENCFHLHELEGKKLLFMALSKQEKIFNCCSIKCWEENPCTGKILGGVFTAPCIRTLLGFVRSSA